MNTHRSKDWPDCPDVEAAEIMGELHGALALGGDAKVRPEILGEMFQGAMDPPERRRLGAHYTSERDIMKVLRCLFLDELEERLRSAREARGGKRRSLVAMQVRLASMKFLDPACGCGNFLLLAYRELRRLEHVILRELEREGGETIDVEGPNRVSLEQFFGIEISPLAAEIARTSMWLMQDQMDRLERRLEAALGFERGRPRTTSANIVCANALRTNWADLLPPSDDVFVFGNPPFVGKKERNAAQKSDMEFVFRGSSVSFGSLDYVAGFFFRLADYLQGAMKAVVVATNSITQGEQVGILWPSLLAKGVRIFSAHRPFAWTSEARGQAQVHVVVLGLTKRARGTDLSSLHEHARDGSSSVSLVKNVSPYLLSGGDTVCVRRSKPVSPDAPLMTKGSEVTDGGHLLLDEDARSDLLSECPVAESYVRSFTGGDEFINGRRRYCLWLRDAPPSLLQASGVRERLERTGEFRRRSKKARTVALARTPHLFGEDRQPNSTYLLVPKVSSERRKYLPIGFVAPTVIVSGSALVIPGAQLWHFGILSSVMHMAWTRVVCGRMKSDYQYSVEVVYNNFPWPNCPDPELVSEVEVHVRSVLHLRAMQPDKALCDLYDPASMPAKLAKAHEELDRAVERLYRHAPFDDDRERVEHLFCAYERSTWPASRAAS